MLVALKSSFCVSNFDYSHGPILMFDKYFEGQEELSKVDEVLGSLSQV